MSGGATGDVAALEMEFPGWKFTVHSVEAASGPGGRVLHASRGTTWFASPSIDELRRKIRAAG